MKSYFILLFALFIAVQSNAQDLANVLGAFKTAELPYEFPEGATSTFGDEEFESPYPVVDIDVFNRATGAELPLETQYTGMHKIGNSTIFTFWCYWKFPLISITVWRIIPSSITR